MNSDHNITEWIYTPANLSNISDFCMLVSLIDPTLHEDDSKVKCLLFHKDRDHFPYIAVGNIVRFHRLKVRWLTNNIVRGYTRHTKRALSVACNWKMMSYLRGVWMRIFYCFQIFDVMQTYWNIYSKISKLVPTGTNTLPNWDSAIHIVLIWS